MGCLWKKWHCEFSNVGTLNDCIVGHLHVDGIVGELTVGDSRGVDGKEVACASCVENLVGGGNSV